MYFRLINTFYRQCIGGWHYPQRCWYGIMCQNMRYICHVSTLEVFEGKYLLDIQWLQLCIDIRFWKYSDTIRVKRLFWKDLKSGWANFPGNTHFFPRFRCWNRDNFVSKFRVLLVTISHCENKGEGKALDFNFHHHFQAAKAGKDVISSRKHPWHSLLFFYEFFRRNFNSSCGTKRIA